MSPNPLSIRSLVAVFRQFHTLAISSLAVTALALPLPAAAQAANNTASHTRVAEDRVQAQMLTQPLGFELNHGQAEAGVDFVSRGRGYSLLLAGNGSTFVTAGTDSNAADRSIHMQLVGADAAAKPRAEKPLTGQTNYLIGSDPSKWVHGVQQFQQVRLANAYPGIDLLYYGNQKQVEHDFIVSPGVDPKQIRMQFSDAASQIISEHGDLQLKTRSGSTVALQKPVAYQNGADGSRRVVQAEYATLSDHTIGFKLGSYDRSRPLIIDPVVINYSTYFGGNDQDSVVDLKLDAAGNMYVLMSTDSTDLPVVSQIAGACVGACGPKNPDTLTSSLNNPMRDFYLAKLDPTGQTLIFGTYIGGSKDDTPGALSLSSDGAIYIAGATRSSDFPLVNQYSSTLAPAGYGGLSILTSTLTRLSTDGSTILYSSLIGGGLINYAEGDGGRYWETSTGSIAAGTNGIVYLLGFGETNNEGGGYGNFVDAKNTNFLAGDGTFLAKFDTTKTGNDSLLYATTFGQPGDRTGESLQAVALDSKQNVWVFGTAPFSAAAPPIPTANAVQPVCDGGGQCSNVFLFELNPTGTMTYATFLGGTVNSGGGPGIENALSMYIDPSDNIYLTGVTESTDFPIKNGATTTSSGSAGFLTKLSPGALSILYSTYTPLALYMAGTPSGIVGGVRSDPSGFPVKNGIQNKNSGYTPDAVFQIYDTTQVGDASLLASSYLGSTSITVGQTAAFDSEGNFLFAGYTESTTLPVVNPFQSTCSGGCYSNGNGYPDGFISRVQLGASTGTVTLLPATQSFPGTAAGSTSAVMTSVLKNTTSSAFAFTSGFTNSTDFKDTDDCFGMVAAGASCTFSFTFAPQSAGSLTSTFSLTGTTTPATTLTVALSGTATGAPVLTLSPSTFAFGSVASGENPVTQTLMLKNTGNVADNALTFHFNETDTGGQTPSLMYGAPCTSLAVGATCDIVITFTPHTGVTAAGTLTVNGDAGVTPAVATVTGTGTAPAAAKLSTASFSYGSVTDGTTTPATTFTLSNTGGSSLTVNSITITGAGAAAFAVVPGSNCSTAVASNAACTFSVTFSPTAVTSYAATVNVADQAGTQTLTLNGTGIAQPPLTLSPSTQNFGTVGVGATSAAQTITLTNPGTAAVAIPLAGINETVRNFEAPSGGDGTCNTLKTLAPGASCTYLEVFAPIATGPATATFVLFDSSSKQLPATVAFTGTGVAQPPLTLLPSMINFGSLGVGATSVAHAITLTNPGTAAVAIPLAGINETVRNFEASSGGDGTCNTLKTLAPGASCTYLEVFAPIAAGPATATFVLFDSSSKQLPATVVFTGTGVAQPPLTLSPSMINFGSLGVGATSVAHAITLTNPGTAAVAIPLAGINETVRNFEASSGGDGTCSAVKTLAPGASCTYLEVFAPIAAGPATATFVLFDSSSKQLPATVAFTGTGVAQPALTLSPSMINFGSLGVGATSAAQAITLTNPGTAAVAIPLAGINETVHNFEASSGGDGTCNTLKTLAPGASCTYLEVFAPIAAGPATATFVLFDSSSKQLPATVAFTGQGVATLAPDFTLNTPAGAAITVSSGSFTNLNLQVASVSDSNPFTSPVTLSVSGLPAGATASFSSPTVTPIPGGATVLMRVAVASATSQNKPASPLWPGNRDAAMGISAAALMAGFFGFRRKLNARLLLCVCALGLISGMVGCGVNASNATTATTSNVVVTATSGSISHSITVALTIQ